jgi:hypothetical protein
MSEYKIGNYGSRFEVTGGGQAGRHLQATGTGRELRVAVARLQQTVALSRTKHFELAA